MFTVDGLAAGGVYSTEVEVTCDSVPQEGEQATPFAVSDQVTPLLVESFCTVAVNVLALVPAWTDVTLFVIVTAMLLPEFPEPDPELQPAMTSTPRQIERHPARAGDLRGKLYQVFLLILSR